mmetsp:Transcript_10215/g.31200  ORF Transcript_10215/g.31200 Transcript_10215/m.31200 type:complete len:253 (-) Transcript_10215:127-885(-)
MLLLVRGRAKSVDQTAVHVFHLRWVVVFLQKTGKLALDFTKVGSQRRREAVDTPAQVWTKGMQGASWHSLDSSLWNVVDLLQVRENSVSGFGTLLPRELSIQWACILLHPRKNQHFLNVEVLLHKGTKHGHPLHKPFEVDHLCVLSFCGNGDKQRVEVVELTAYGVLWQCNDVKSPVGPVWRDENGRMSYEVHSRHGERRLALRHLWQLSGRCCFLAVYLEKGRLPALVHGGPLVTWNFVHVRHGGRHAVGL